MRKLKEKIESIWEYPADARKRNLYGDLRIKFTIRKDGRLASIELERTSAINHSMTLRSRRLKTGNPTGPCQMSGIWTLTRSMAISSIPCTDTGYGRLYPVSSGSVRALCCYGWHALFFEQSGPCVVLAHQPVNPQLPAFGLISHLTSEGVIHNIKSFYVNSSEFL